MKKLWLLACAILLAQPAQAGFSYIDSGGNPQSVFNESAENAPSFTPEVAPPAARSAPKKAVNIRARKPGSAEPAADAATEDIPQVPAVAAESAGAPLIGMEEASVAPSSASPFGITPLRAGQYIGEEPPQASPASSVAESPAAPVAESSPATVTSAAPAANEEISAPMADAGAPLSIDPPTDPKIGNQSLNTSGEIVARVVMDDGYVIEVPKQTEQERRAYERYARTHEMNSAGTGEEEIRKPARKKTEKPKAEKPKAEKPKAEKPRAGEGISRPTAEQRRKAAKPEEVVVPVAPEAFMPDEPAPVSEPEIASPAIVEPSAPEPPVVREPAAADDSPDPSMRLVPPANVNVPDFVLEKGSLKDQLSVYAREQGYRLEWKHPADLMVTNSTVFSRGSFAGNIRNLFETLERIGKYGLSAKLYNGDRTLVVE